MHSNKGKEKGRKAMNKNFYILFEYFSHLYTKYK